MNQPLAQNVRLLIGGGAVLALIGFVAFPLVKIGGITGLTIATNALSSSQLAALLLWGVPVGAIASLYGFKDKRWAWASVAVVIGVLGYYVLITQNNALFRMGEFGFLDIGFWAIIIGGALGIAGSITLNGKPTADTSAQP